MSRCSTTCSCRTSSSFFFFNDTATTEIYTLSLHDALPIFALPANQFRILSGPLVAACFFFRDEGTQDRKSTRLNSSHANISYAVFCLQKKKHPKHRPAHPDGRGDRARMRRTHVRYASRTAL